MKTIAFLLFLVFFFFPLFFFLSPPTISLFPSFISFFPAFCFVFYKTSVFSAFTQIKHPWIHFLLAKHPGTSEHQTKLQLSSPTRLWPRHSLGIVFQWAPWELEEVVPLGWAGPSSDLQCGPLCPAPTQPPRAQLAPSIYSRCIAKKDVCRKPAWPLCSPIQHSVNLATPRGILHLPSCDKNLHGRHFQKQGRRDAHGTYSP